MRIIISDDNGNVFSSLEAKDEKIQEFGDVLDLLSEKVLPDAEAYYSKLKNERNKKSNVRNIRE